MIRNLLITLIFCLFSFSLSSCDGGNGEREEKFTIFDATIRILDIESSNPDSTIDCPQIANLKLSLSINDNNLSGSAELLAFGHVGDSVPVSGSVQGNNFFLNPFNLSVDGDLILDPPIPCCVLTLTLDSFDGFLLDENEDGAIDGLEGNTSGDVFSGQAFTLLCDSGFAGEFSGLARSPEGCVSPQEAPTLECPAEGFVSQCDVYAHYFCFGYCVPSDEGDICSDLSFNASDCEVIDCLNVRCPGTGIVDLEGLEDYGSFQYVTPVGTTETCS